MARLVDYEHPEWDEEERAFAAAWRKQPKWVVSRPLKSVGPNGFTPFGPEPAVVSWTSS